MVSSALSKQPRSLVEHAGELLSLESILPILPGNRSSNIAILSKLTTSQQIEHPPSSPIQLIVLVAYLRSICQEGTDAAQKHDRLADWIDSMMAIYPAEPTKYEVEDLLEIDSQLAPYEESLRAILLDDPGLPLVWAAQVVDEEGVNVPMEGGQSEYHLYVPVVK